MHFIHDELNTCAFHTHFIDELNTCISYTINSKHMHSILLQYWWIQYKYVFHTHAFTNINIYKHNGIYIWKKCCTWLWTKLDHIEPMTSLTIVQKVPFIGTMNKFYLTCSHYYMTRIQKCSLVKSQFNWWEKYI